LTTTFRIAPAIIPHLSGRALTMKRYPNGVDGEFFYEKNAPKHRPDWVHTVPIWSHGNNRTMYYVEVNEPANAGVAGEPGRRSNCIPRCRWQKLWDCPTMMVFDLDPDPRRTSCNVAR